MTASMVSLVPHLTTNCRVRRVRVSVPLIAALVDNERYYLPDTLPTPAGEELRAMTRPRIAQPKLPRAPSLRTLVRYALKCESAEELGKRLKRRYDRQQRRMREAASLQMDPGAQDPPVLQGRDRIVE